MMMAMRRQCDNHLELEEQGSMCLRSVPNRAVNEAENCQGLQGLT